MAPELTALDLLIATIEERMNPEELVDVLGLEIEDLTEALRSHIAAAHPDTWEYL